MKELVNGSQLLTDDCLFYDKHVRVGDDALFVLAAWTLHCHAWPAWTRTPYLHVSSATPECGKTLLLELVELMVPNAMFVIGCSNAVLARVIEQERPVLLLDEFDQIRRGNKELYAAVLQTVNGGYKKSGSRPVLVPSKGEGWALKRLSTFCPKILSGLAGLEPATAGRCIPIVMERMLPGDRVAEIDEYITEPEANALLNRAADWAKQNLKRLRDARPDAPAALGHRQREVSRPLLAVADVVGDGWGERIRGALVRLFAAKASAPDDDIKIQLLHDIQDVFGDDRQKLSSEYVAQELAKIEASPWSAWGKSQRPINQSQIATQLGANGFKVYPKQQRNDDGTNRKGYNRADFEPLWRRYPQPLCHSKSPSRNTDTTLINTDDFSFSARNKKQNVSPPKSETANKDAGCFGVSAGSKIEAGRGLFDNNPAQSVPDEELSQKMDDFWREK